MRFFAVFPPLLDICSTRCQEPLRLQGIGTTVLSTYDIFVDFPSWSVKLIWISVIFDSVRFKLFNIFLHHQKIIWSAYFWIRKKVAFISARNYWNRIFCSSKKLFTKKRKNKINFDRHWIRLSGSDKSMKRLRLVLGSEYSKSTVSQAIAGWYDQCCWLEELSHWKSRSIDLD